MTCLPSRSFCKASCNSQDACSSSSSSSDSAGGVSQDVTRGSDAFNCTALAGAKHRLIRFFVAGTVNSRNQLKHCRTLQRPDLPHPSTRLYSAATMMTHILRMLTMHVVLQQNRAARFLNG